MRLYQFIGTAILAITAQIATAQPDFTKENAWIQGQKTEYQRWLDQSNLGQSLYVDAVEADTMIVLYLGFRNNHDRDTVASVWRALAQQYREKEDVVLEHFLFRRAMACFDVDEDHIALKIFDTYDPNQDYCFKRKVRSIRGIIATDSTVLCKADIRDNISISVGNLRPLRGKDKLSHPKRVERAKVFAYTKAFLQARYGSKVCQGRTVKVVFTKDAPNYEDQEVQIINLCDEIISESQPSLCGVLQYFGHDCNWKKNEKVAIRLTYKSMGKEGFILDISVSGHYGSGFYETEGRQGYHDMDTDFGPQLRTYAQQLKNDLNNYLLQKL